MEAKATIQPVPIISTNTEPAIYKLVIVAHGSHSELYRAMQAFFDKIK